MKDLPKIKMNFDNFQVPSENQDHVLCLINTVMGILWQHCQDPTLKSFDIIHESINKPHAYRKDLKIWLNASKNNWGDYVLEFSHEFCHFLCYTSKPSSEEGHSNQWFEETICQTASLFVLNTIGENIEGKIPLQSPRTAFLDYRNQVLLKYNVNPSSNNYDLLEFYTQNKSRLENAYANGGYATRFQEFSFALAIIPFLELHPDQWQTIRYLNRTQKNKQMSFSQYLSSWIHSIPSNIDPKFPQFIMEKFISSSR